MCKATNSFVMYVLRLDAMTGIQTDTEEGCTPSSHEEAWFIQQLQSCENIHIFAPWRLYLLTEMASRAPWSHPMATSRPAAIRPSKHHEAGISPPRPTRDPLSAT